MAKFKDLTGQKFGKLTVIKPVGKNQKGNYLWECECACGNTSIVRSSNLLTGDTKSCGCLQREMASKTLKTHGLSGSRIYIIWEHMIARCNNPNDSRYKNYGGRGISVCDEWRDFLLFNKWAMSNGYNDNLTIDRIDVNGNYEPSNCRWTDKKVQANNKRNNHLVTYENKTLTISQWEEETGIDARLILYRLSKGWSTKRTLTSPPDTSFNNSGKYHPRSKAVMCLGVYYDSIHALSDAIHVPYATLIAWLNGWNKMPDKWKAMNIILV